MASESAVYGLSMLAIVLGLVILLLGIALPNDMMVPVGGIVGLLGVGLMTAHIARLPSPH